MGVSCGVPPPVGSTHGKQYPPPRSGDTRPAAALSAPTYRWHRRGVCMPSEYWCGSVRRFRFSHHHQCTHPCPFPLSPLLLRSSHHIPPFASMMPCNLLVVFADVISHAAKHAVFHDLRTMVSTRETMTRMKGEGKGFKWW